MDDLLRVAKELLQDFDLYGPPVRLDVIAKLRRAVEAAQQSTQTDDAEIDPATHALRNLDSAISPPKR